MIELVSTIGVTKQSDDLTTRDRLLTVAETLLLGSGYDAVSVRAINSAAGMNPAAVHYHFGSKEGLVGALLEERLAPIWQAQLAGVSANPTVAELVDIVVRPLAELSHDPVGHLRLNLLARMVLCHQDIQFTGQWFRMESWVDLLRAARPELSRTDAAERWTMAFTLVLQFFGDPYSDRPSPLTVSVDTLRAFLIAGLSS
jgi:AcrR family transcriptional regulator